MAKLTMVENETIPTGEYPTQITDLIEEEGKFGQQVKFTLEIIGDGDYTGKNLLAWAALSPSMKGKLAKWAAACGIQLEPGIEFDTDELIGKRVMAVVLVKTKDDGSEFNKVEELKAPKRRPVPAPAGRPAATHSEEGEALDAPGPVDKEDPFADQ